MLLLATVFVACSDDNDNENDDDSIILETSISELIFTASGGTQSFDIKCNTNWQITKCPTWCQINLDIWETHSKDTTITISVSDDEITEERKDEIEITSGKKKKYVSIKQGCYTILSSEQDLQNFKNNGNTTFNGSILIKGEEIRSLSTLGNILEKIQGDLSIKCENLTNFDGLYNLTNIEGNFVIQNGKFTTFEGLNKLNQIGKDFHLSNNFESLETFKGLDNLTKIGGSFYFNAYKKRIEKQPITSFKGLNKLTEIGGDFIISTMGSLNSLDSFEGLENLQTINGDFQILSEARNDGGNDQSLEKLSSFKGLTNLKKIGGSFKISSSAFNTNKESGDFGYSWKCSSLNNLSSFEGLNNLIEIGGNLEILILTGNTGRGQAKECYSLCKIKSFKGLSKLSKIGGNLKLKCFLESVYVNDFASQALNNLTSFEGLEALEEIGGNVEITGDKYHTFSSLISLEGLTGVKKITNEINIDYCSNLVNIDALINLNDVAGISISNCPKLYDFCVFKNIVKELDIPFYAGDNGYNPTKIQLINGECSSNN